MFGPRTEAYTKMEIVIRINIGYFNYRFKVFDENLVTTATEVFQTRKPFTAVYDCAETGIRVKAD